MAALVSPPMRHWTISASRVVKSQRGQAPLDAASAVRSGAPGHPDDRLRGGMNRSTA